MFYSKDSQLSSVWSHAVTPKLRPDTMLVSENCTLLLGEDKHTNMQILKGSEWIFLACTMVKFLSGYAAAETSVQRCFLPCQADQVRSCFIDLLVV